MAGSGGLGLLLAVTFDGVPENLSLGTTLIETGPLGAAALAGSILLSNLPEAAGGAASMREDGMSERHILALWTGVAALLSLGALGGRWTLGGANAEPIRSPHSRHSPPAPSSRRSRPRCFPRQASGIRMQPGRPSR